MNLFYYPSKTKSVQVSKRFLYSIFFPSSSYFHWGVWQCFKFFRKVMTEFSMRTGPPSNPFTWCWFISPKGILTLKLGSQKKIIPHLACLLARLLRYFHRHVSRYAPLEVPCRRTQIRRNLVELFLTVTLIIWFVRIDSYVFDFKNLFH